MRTFYCAANWKLNKSPNETNSFVNDFLPYVEKYDKPKLKTIIFPPAVNWVAFSEASKGSSLFWGPQNCYFETSGAFTGENSAQIAKELGAQFLLIGHSERRHVFGEKNEDLAHKVALSCQLNLIPMLCVGEQLQERDAGQTIHVIHEQLVKGLAELDQSKEFAIAYEPVWAIGTGKVASTEQVAEVHSEIRKGLSSILNNEVAEKTSILYGGSVKPDNAAELASLKDVDGFLVGGASLKVDSFAELLKIASANCH